MKHTTFGRSGLAVSRLCLGTMTFGGQCDEAQSHAILDAAAAGGIDFIDTADVYPMGGGPNLKTAGEQVIWWLRERCGKSEEVPSVIKSDLAGGQLPSGLFGANAAWWALTILSHNLNAAMKRLVLGKGWMTKRMKAM